MKYNYLVPRLFFLLSLVLFLAVVSPVQASGISPTPPPGFELLAEQPGVWLYRKLYYKGTPDFVQVIHLQRGASVHLLHAPVSAPRPGHGMFGGSDARLGLDSLRGYWLQAAATSPQAFCVSNGQFFYLPEAPTRLALPLKVDGKLITEGFGYDQYPDKLMLELWPDHVDIRLLTAEALYASNAPDILGGLPEDANKRAPYSVGRTFIGIDDWDQDGFYEVVYLFTTSTASQKAVAQVLRDFGAEKVMMLDGGGSTQLICQGKTLIPSDRNIPQAIAVVAAQSPHQFTPTAQILDISEIELAQPDQAIIINKPPSRPLPQTPHIPPPKPQLSDLLAIPLLMLPVFVFFFKRIRITT